MAEQWRLFIAVELPAAVKARLAEVQADLKRVIPGRAVRWVDPSGVHLTLKFLGDTPVTWIDALGDALTAASSGCHPFDLATASLGCFPNAHRPRVLWLGVSRDLQAIGDLHDAVDREVSGLGFPREERAFHPHLTLGRIGQEAPRAEVEQIGPALQRIPLAEATAWHVNEVVLFRSELRPSGAQYTPLLRVPLGPLA